MNRNIQPKKIEEVVFFRAKSKEFSLNSEVSKFVRHRIYVVSKKKLFSTLFKQMTARINQSID